MSAVAFVDLRHQLLCCPTLEDFLSFHAARGDGGTVDAGASPCETIAAQRAVLDGAQARLQLASLSISHGCPVPSDGSQPVEGVVVEIGGAGAIDVLAAYSDGTIAWYDGMRARLSEGTADAAHRATVEGLFGAVHAAAGPFGPAQPAVPPIPSPGEIVISRITAGGLAFAAGPSRDLVGDKYAGPIVHWSMQLADLLKA